MNVIQKFMNFFRQLFSFGNDSQTQALPAPEESSEQIADKLEVVENQISEIQEKKKDKVNVENRTLLTRLNMIEQEITLFENEFPEEYKAFMEQVQTLKLAYQTSLSELNKDLRFEIDPDIDSFKTGRVIKLEKEVKQFIECQVKFSAISNCLQRLIVKLNILYNGSIFHSSDKRKMQAISQIEHGIASVTNVAEEFKESNYILADKRLKERVVELIAYADYLIFKITLRNDRQSIPVECVQKLVILNQFAGFNYLETFKSFVQNEICDLEELIPLLADKEYGKNLEKQADSLLNQLNYAENLRYVLLSRDFWDKEFDFESGLLEMLKLENNVSKDKNRVCIIERMGISVTKDDVVVSPITQTYLSLMSVFSKTHDQRIFALMKALKGISKDTSYKEIYFLLQLFDVIEVIKTTSSDLTKHIQKYLDEYPYNPEDIKDRLRRVKSAPNKEYVVMLTLDGYSQEIMKALEKLNFDFRVAGNDLLINSFYFIGLDNVLSSFKRNTQYTTI